jgi:hypothetical protein
MTNKHWIGAGPIILVYLAFGLYCGLIVPSFENLDEIEHFEVVRYITGTGQLPVHGRPEAGIYRYRQEASQPPLYHMLSAGLVRLLGLKVDDTTASWPLNPWVACGPGAASLYDNRTVLYHNHNQEKPPWQGTLLTLHSLRVWSTLLQSVTVAGTFALARRAFPQRPEVGPVAAALVAFNPQFLLVASAVNNDNLVTPLVTLGLCLLLRIWQDGVSVQRAVALGALIGFAGLSKLSGWALLGLVGLVTLAMVVRSKSVQRRFVLTAVLIPVVALFITSWWFWRNWRLYGDPTALQPMLELVGTRDGSPILPLLETGRMFLSFWGQLPCSFYPPAFYVFYAVLTALAVGGLAWRWRGLTPAEQAVGMILGSWFLLIVASWIRWDAITPAPGGRLLFPALPAVALLMGLGIGTLTRGRFKHGETIVTGILALMALWTLLIILPGFFAPPHRSTNPDAVHPDHPLDATLGDSVRVRGYDLALADGDDSQRPTLDVTLYWEALAPMAEDYVMTLQLVSPVPGDTTLRWNYNSWPGRGNYPTSAWQPGEVILDRYRFHLPEADLPTQAWDVHMALFQRETGERLPVHAGESNLGDHVTLTQLRVPGVQAACPEEGKLTSEIHFGESVALTHASVILEKKAARVVLCWEALRDLSDNYTVFVHLLDASGVLVGTGDGPPMEGAFPTSMWHPGDIVLDVHRLVPDSVEGSAKLGEQGAHSLRVTVGLYNPIDGSRLPAYAGETLIPGAAVEIWPSHP